MFTAVKTASFILNAKLELSSILNCSSCACVSQLTEYKKIFLFNETNKFDLPSLTVLMKLVGLSVCRRGPKRRFGEARTTSHCLGEVSLGRESQYGRWKLSLLFFAPGLACPYERWWRDDISLWSFIPRRVPWKTDAAPHLSHLRQEQLRNWKSLGNGVQNFG